MATSFPFIYLHYHSKCRVARHQSCALCLNQDRHHLSVISMHQNVLAIIQKKKQPWALRPNGRRWGWRLSALGLGRLLYYKRSSYGLVWVRQAQVLLFHTLSTMVMSRHITIYRVISVNWHHGAGHGWKQHPYESSVCSITYANNADSWAEMTPAPCFPSPVQMAIKRRKCPFFQ